MISRTTVLAVAGATGLAFLAGAALAGSPGRGSAAPEFTDHVHADGTHHRHGHGKAGAAPFLGATWAFRPATVAELTARAGAVVVAEVTAVRGGPALAAPPGTPDAATAAIPTQRISLRVTDVLAGQAPARLQLFKTGDAFRAIPGDPHYSVGQRYVLFVNARRPADGTYRPTAPDGRLLVDSAGRLAPMITGPVADQVRGWTVARIATAVSGGTGR